MGDHVKFTQSTDFFKTSHFFQLETNRIRKKSFRDRSLSIEQRGGGGGGGGAEDFVKIFGKISGPNILASENLISQQKLQHKFHAPTKSTLVSLGH